jgi:Concanavalin A-like lectin/glucanases superfamily
MRRINWAHRLGGKGRAAFALLLLGCTGAAGTADELTGSSSNALTADDGGVGSDGGPIPSDGGSSSSDGGAAADGGPVGPDGGPTGPARPLGFWTFDDCSGTSDQLADSSGQGATATRSARATCTPGVDGQAILFDRKNDVVTVPNRPTFAFSNRVAVAAWINPTSLTGTRPIINQSDGTGTSFALQIRNDAVEFVIERASGPKVTTRAPIGLNAWTHVAASFDGEFVFLFVDGRQVGQVAGAGILKTIDAPLRIGNDVQERPFRGAIERVWISSDPVTPQDIAELACIRRPETLAISPLTSGPVPPNTTVNYEVKVTNQNVGTSCGGAFYSFSLGPVPSGINASVTPNFIPDLPPGQTGSFSVPITGTEEADTGAHKIGFAIFGSRSFLSGELSYEMTEPTGCFVRTGRELMIRDLSVVEDPIRTTSNGPAGDPRSGVWTFARLMQDMAPTPEQAPAMVERLFGSWLTDQSVNSFTAPARPTIAGLVLNSWPRVDGQLDLTRAPLRLLSIVNRIDVRNLDRGHAGEGRFIFGVLDPLGNQTQFTVILEYHLVASTDADVLGWANAWHALGSHPFPSEGYNAALQDITSRFAGRNAAPGRPNGSALSQLRTNEIALAGPWELREFHLSADDGFLHPATVELTPDLGFNNTPTLASFVNANESAILADQHVVPLEFQGAPFAGAAVLNNLTDWRAPGITNNEARHHFSLNTCNGCHSIAETGTLFLHVLPRNPGQTSFLSGFLTGTTIPDPVTGIPRTFNDLGRRNADLKQLVCATATMTNSTLRKGIGRVH